MSQFAAKSSLTRRSGGPPQFPQPHGRRFCFGVEHWPPSTSKGLAFVKHKIITARSNRRRRPSSTTSTRDFAPFPSHPTSSTRLTIIATSHPKNLIPSSPSPNSSLSVPPLFTPEIFHRLHCQTGIKSQKHKKRALSFTHLPIPRIKINSPSSANDHGWRVCGLTFPASCYPHDTAVTSTSPNKSLDLNIKFSHEGIKLPFFTPKSQQ